MGLGRSIAGSGVRLLEGVASLAGGAIAIAVVAGLVNSPSDDDRTCQSAQGAPIADGVLVELNDGSGVTPELEQEVEQRAGMYASRNGCSPEEESKIKLRATDELMYVTTVVCNSEGFIVDVTLGSGIEPEQVEDKYPLLGNCPPDVAKPPGEAEVARYPGEYSVQFVRGLE